MSLYHLVMRNKLVLMFSHVYFKTYAFLISTKFSASSLKILTYLNKVIRYIQYQFFLIHLSFPIKLSEDGESPYFILIWNGNASSKFDTILNIISYFNQPIFLCIKHAIKSNNTFHHAMIMAFSNIQAYNLCTRSLHSHLSLIYAQSSIFHSVVVLLHQYLQYSSQIISST